MKFSAKGALSLAGSFASMLIFFGVLQLFGLKPAIATTLVFVVADSLRRLIWRIPTPQIYIFSHVMALGFGVVDLTVATPFMVRYEGVVTNLIAAAFFIRGAFAARPMIMEMAENARGEPFPAHILGVKSYFRAFTLAWGLYFMLRAGFAFWTVQAYPLAQALAIRAVVGNVSLGLMALASLQGRRIFEACQRLGFFRPAPAALAPREEAA
jgi:intracellular septation protein A